MIASYVLSAIGAFVGQVRQHKLGADRGWSTERAQILSRLNQSPGNHLVMVCYGPQHNLHAEWVYNEADINHSRVVWAHEMDNENNEALFQYFRGRRIWLLLADAAPPDLCRILRTGRVKRDEVGSAASPRLACIGD